MRGAESTLENEHYVVELDLDEGCVTRLFDRELALDLVDAGSPFGFGQYVYDRYTGPLSGTLRLPEGGVRPAAGGTPSLDGRAFLESRALGGSGNGARAGHDARRGAHHAETGREGATPLEVTFRLVHGVRRLDIEYRLGKTSSAPKEGVYFAFPFALEEPEVLFEMTGGVDRPQSRVPGSASHMQVVRHWAALGNAKASVALGTLEASLLEVGNIYLPYPPYRATLDETRAGTLVAWAMNNVWDTNFVLSQAGETRFRFAVASAAGDSRQLGMRASAALVRPLLGIFGAERPVSGLAAAQGSFCTVDHPEVEVVMLAASRRGHDFVAMLHSLAADEVDARVEFPALDVRRVWLGTPLERGERDVTDRAGARVRLRPGDYVCSRSIFRQRDLRGGTELRPGRRRGRARLRANRGSVSGPRGSARDRRPCGARLGCARGPGLALRPGSRRPRRRGPARARGGAPGRLRLRASVRRPDLGARRPGTARAAGCRCRDRARTRQRPRRARPSSGTPTFRSGERSRPSVRRPAPNLGQPPGARGTEQRLLFVDWPIARPPPAASSPRGSTATSTWPIAGHVFARRGDALRATLAHARAAARSARGRPSCPARGAVSGSAERLGIETDAPNLAWSYELIAPESGSCSAATSRSRSASSSSWRSHGEDVLGAPSRREVRRAPSRSASTTSTRSGAGTCRSSATRRRRYARETFGLAYTQDETYYVVETTPGATDLPRSPRRRRPRRVPSGGREQRSTAGAFEPEPLPADASAPSSIAST